MLREIMHKFSLEFVVNNKPHIYYFENRDYLYLRSIWNLTSRSDRILSLYKITKKNGYVKRINA